MIQVLDTFCVLGLFALPCMTFTVGLPHPYEHAHAVRQPDDALIVETVDTFSLRIVGVTTGHNPSSNDGRPPVDPISTKHVMHGTVPF